VLVDRGGELALKARELAQGVVAVGVELRDDRLDLRSPPLRVLDDPLRLRAGRFARLARILVGFLAYVRRVLVRRAPRVERRALGPRAQLGALVLHVGAQLLRLLLGGEQYLRG
jgi:hypothetical protein